MKKLTVICLTLLVTICLSVSAFAGFVQSPSNNLAPTVEEVKAENVPDGTNFMIVITPYKERDSLSPENKDLLENAYNDIKEASDLSSLVAKLADIAKEKNVDTKDLAVPDLFDISPNTENHGKVSIKLSSDTFANFFALLHLKNGVWEVVESAKLENGLLTFSVDDFSPFAVVVKSPKQSPITSDDIITYACGFIALAAVLGLVYCCIKVKKSSVK